MNLPKFVFEDVPLFLGLISDLFPGLDCPRVRYPDFNDAVEQVLEDSGYVLLPVQVGEGRSSCRFASGFVALYKKFW
jgi:dynein heavy chain